jgi:hypothetical protein
MLGKRLAQCLYPPLPFGVHSSTLRVYDVVFQNTYSLAKQEGELAARKLAAEIFPFMAIGLFPFFEHSSATIKPELLKLARKYFIGLGPELIPAIVGMTVSLVPGLGDNSEDTQKKVYDVLDAVAGQVGKRFLYSAVWTAILRVQKVRLACFKFLAREFKQTRKLSR